jgi:Helix-hairpin-helix motif
LEGLQLVPGIGPATADNLSIRKWYAALKSADGLLAVRGIGKKRLDKMRKYLVAGKSATGVKPVGVAPASQLTNCSTGAQAPPLEEASLKSKFSATPRKPAATAAAPVPDKAAASIT